jgi:hypothetical protein
MIELEKGRGASTLSTVVWRSKVMLPHGTILGSRISIDSSGLNPLESLSVRTSPTVKNNAGESSVTILFTLLLWHLKTFLRVCLVVYCVSTLSCTPLFKAKLMSETRICLSPATVTL